MLRPDLTAKTSGIFNKRLRLVLTSSSIVAAATSGLSWKSATWWIMGDRSRFPVQSALFQRVNVGENKDSGKASHAGQRRRPLSGEIPELNGPRVHEHHFD